MPGEESRAAIRGSIPRVPVGTAREKTREVVLRRACGEGGGRETRRWLGSSGALAARSPTVTGGGGRRRRRQSQGSRAASTRVRCRGEREADPFRSSRAPSMVPVVEGARLPSQGQRRIAAFRERDERDSKATAIETASEDTTLRLFFATRGVHNERLCCEPEPSAAAACWPAYVQCELVGPNIFPSPMSALGLGHPVSPPPSSGSCRAPRWPSKTMAPFCGPAPPARWPRVPPPLAVVPPRVVE